LHAGINPRDVSGIGPVLQFNLRFLIQLKVPQLRFGNVKARHQPRRTSYFRQICSRSQVLSRIDGYFFQHSCDSGVNSQRLLLLHFQRIACPHPSPFRLFRGELRPARFVCNGQSLFFELQPSRHRLRPGP